MPYKPTVLMIEDDKNIRSLVHITLTTQGYKSLEAENAMQGLSMVYSHHPDVILLDLGLPDLDGTQVIKRIRENMATPIIVISARGHDHDKVEALDVGADDYLTKPFSMTELLARIRVALRHRLLKGESEEQPPHQFSLDGLVVDFDRHEVFLKGSEVHLTPIEFRLIELLAKYPGKVLTHRYIINEIWGGYSESDHQSLRVFMASIRRKIEENSAKPRYLVTEVGVGYRLKDE